MKRNTGRLFSTLVQLEYSDPIEIMRAAGGSNDSRRTSGASFAVAGPWLVCRDSGALVGAVYLSFNVVLFIMMMPVRVMKSK
jgi:hypothetical protein